MRNQFVYFVGTELARGRNGEFQAKGLAILQRPTTRICPIFPNGEICFDTILPLPANKRGELGGALLGTTRDMGELFGAMVSGAKCKCSELAGFVKVVRIGMEKSDVKDHFGDIYTVPTHTISVPWPAG